MTSADKRQGDVTVTGGGGTPASGHGAGRGGGGGSFSAGSITSYVLRLSLAM